MAPDPSDDSSPDGIETETDVEESEIARFVQRYSDPAESVSDDELRNQLQKAIHGTIVDLDSDDGSIIVVVERPSAEGDEQSRDCYAVHHVTGLDGEPALDWSYLGSVD